MCIYAGIENTDTVGQTAGYLTKEIIGTGLRGKLGNEEWTYRDNLYPTLKGFENHPIAMIARSPVYLDDKNKADFDQHNNIRKCFLVNIENNVKWTKAFDVVNIVSKNNIYNDVFLRRLGKDTIYAGIGNVKKTVPITVTANNQPCSFDLVLIPNPANAGTVRGAGN
jgi:hypothetical protein